MGAQDEHIFLQFDNLELTDNDDETDRMFVVIDNVVGGRVEMAAGYGINPWINCNGGDTKQCATSLGYDTLNKTNTHS
jgi:hypothetical protein